MTVRTASRAPRRTSQTAEPAGATPVAVLGLLDRARDGLLQACHTTRSEERYQCAHLAALRVGAAVLAARAHPSRRRGPRSVWELLPGIAPELVEWANFFALSARRCRQIDRGTAVVGAREADDMIRATEDFLGQVLAVLGLPPGSSVSAAITPVSVGPGPSA